MTYFNLVGLMLASAIWVVVSGATPWSFMVIMVALVVGAWRWYRPNLFKGGK